MPVDSLSSLPSGTLLETDICIVGAGPAGLALAREFFGTNTRVLVVETGTLEASAAAESLSTIENVGAPRELDQTLVRNRVLGGSALTWMGRCIPFSPIDFAERAWVPNSGWPIDFQECSQFFPRAGELLSLGPSVYDESAWELLKTEAPKPELDPNLFQTIFYQYAKDRSFPFKPMRMGESFVAHATPNIRVLLDATVTHVDTNATETRLEGLELRSLNGAQARVRAKLVALCAGGIENARMLLASNRVVPYGVGNRYDLVGRFLMDHQRCVVARFDAAKSAAVEDRFDFYNVQTPLGRRSYLPGLALTPAVQEREGLLNCAAWIGLDRSPQDPWSKMRALSLGRTEHPAADLRTVVKHSGLMGRGLYRRYVKHRGLLHLGKTLSLACMVEQVPDPNSRISLSTQRDALGLPVPKIDWRVSRRELETMARMATLVAAELKRVGLAEPELVEWVRDKRYELAPVLDVAHPTGTTRMSSDPTRGVVDVNGRVHGVAGLYVTGSAVFPTAGHANPTLMVVAMAIRLADHFKKLLAAQAPALTEKQPAPPARARARSRVFVTGASGRIGSAMVRELVKRGYAVRAHSSRENRTHTSDVEWVRMDWRKDIDFSGVVRDCDAVIHLGAELRNADDMTRVNRDATRALAEACESSGVRHFAYASTICVYGSPLVREVSEDCPVITGDSEYMAEPRMRAYARTKLEGERAIQQTAANVNYTIFRPSVVCDAETIASLRAWTVPHRVRCAARYTNHVCMDDVVGAFVWSMERALRSNSKGSVSTYNISDDHDELDTYFKLYQRAFAQTRDPRFLCPVRVPAAFDLLKDTVRYRPSVTRLRYPLGMIRFSSLALERDGFRRPTGLVSFYDGVFSRFGGLA